MGAERLLWGDVDDNESIAAVQAAIDLGINLIDTAPSYGNGHSEEIIGKAIQGRRDAVVIATKCGLIGRGRGRADYERCLRPESILRECEASLRRLRVETIDVYLLHWPDPETPLETTMTALPQLREQGKIRAIGLANFDWEAIAAARRYGDVQCIEPALSMFNRRAADDVIPYAREYGIGVIACSPLAKGLLAGRFDARSRFSDARASDPQFTGTQYRRNLDAIERLRAVAGRYGKTVGQLAINWAISFPGVTAAAVGAKRPSQVTENAAAAGWTIAPEDMREIDGILQERD
jgi:aryl-alcohol dehydrogenase-like predicted oxidoreductase